MVGQTNLIPPPLFGAVVGSRTRDPGSGMDKTENPGWIKGGSGIRDKHPGSATLELRIQTDPDPAWQFFVAIDKNMFSFRIRYRNIQCCGSINISFGSSSAEP
jgi:hypothetical protein